MTVVSASPERLLSSTSGAEARASSDSNRSYGRGRNLRNNGFDTAPLISGAVFKKCKIQESVGLRKEWVGLVPVEILALCFERSRA